MAFPSIRNTATTNGTTASATPVVNLPTGIRAGDTVLVLLRQSAAGVIGFPAGWTELFDDTTDPSANQTCLAWRKADGTEGATITCSSGNGKFAAVAWAIPGAADPLIRPPEFATLVTGTSLIPDPGTVTPTGGAKDYLWLALAGQEGENTGPTYPTNYTVSQLAADSGTAGVVTTNVRVAGAVRTNLNAASENPGTFTYTGTSDDWTATTVAVHPADVVTAPLDRESTAVSGAPRLQTKPSHGMAALTIAVSLLQTTLAPVDAPFKQADWPTARRTPSIQVTVRSQPSEATAAAGSPFTQLDWANPVVRVPRFSPIHPPPLLQTTLAPVAGAPPFVERAWTTPTCARPAQVGIATNLLESTLAPAVGAAPFAQSSWITPGRRPSVQGNVTSRPAESVVVGPVDTFVQTVWLTPARFRPPAQPWPIPNLLTSTLAPPAGPPPFKQGEWPVPVRPKVRPTITFSNVLMGIPDDPFVPIAWPNPAAVKRQPAVGWTQDRKSYYQDQKPFLQADWPTPLRLRSTRVDPVPNLQASTLAPALATKPFLQSEWPVPALQKSQTAIGWTQDRKPYYQDLKPFGLTDWPTPLLLRTVRIEPIPNLLASTLAPAVGVLPFVQSGWPIPAPVRQPVRRGWTPDRKAYYQDSAAFSLTDWPMPLRLRSVRVIDAPNLLTGPLAPVPAAPFSLADWLTPPSLKRAPSIDAPNVIVRLPVPQTPFVQGDWPIPRRLGRALELRTWTQVLAHILPPGIATSVQHDAVTVDVTFRRMGGTVDATLRRTVTIDTER